MILLQQMQSPSETAPKSEKMNISQSKEKEVYTNKNELFVREPKWGKNA